MWSFLFWESNWKALELSLDTDKCVLSHVIVYFQLPTYKQIMLSTQLVYTTHQLGQVVSRPWIFFIPSSDTKTRNCNRNRNSNCNCNCNCKCGRMRVYWPLSVWPFKSFHLLLLLTLAVHHELLYITIDILLRFTHIHNCARICSIFHFLSHFQWRIITVWLPTLEMLYKIYQHCIVFSTKTWKLLSSQGSNSAHLYYNLP